MRRLARINIVFSLSLVLGIGTGAAPAWACGQGPLSAPTADVYDLDDDVGQWGVYCGGSPSYALGSALDPSTQAMLLDVEYLGGADGDFTHVYRNLTGDLAANDFHMSLRFNYQPAADSPQPTAAQFSMNSWRAGTRYEWSVQWSNLETTNSWSFWDGSGWVDLGVTRELTPGAWHTIDLRGTITSAGKVRYTSFNVDDRNFKLGLETNPMTGYSGWPDQLAVATTLVGAGATSFQMYLDEVALERKAMTNPSVDGPKAKGK